VYHQPLLRVDAPVPVKVPAVSVKNGGCGIGESRLQEEGVNTVRRTALLMLALMVAAPVVASGVALAKDFVGTE
jgi:hypothetical protein